MVVFHLFPEQKRKERPSGYAGAIAGKRLSESWRASRAQQSMAELRLVGAIEAKSIQRHHLRDLTQLHTCKNDMGDCLLLASSLIQQERNGQKASLFACVIAALSLWLPHFR